MDKKNNKNMKDLFDVINKLIRSLPDEYIKAAEKFAFNSKNNSIAENWTCLVIKWLFEGIDISSTA